MPSTSPSCPKSSAAYEAELIPSRRLRLLLLASAGGATLAGSVLILALPVVPLLKAALELLWIASGIGELASFRRGMSRIDRICIRSDGSLQGCGRSGAGYPLRLLPGSVVLERIAWLRLGFEDGLSSGELLAGSAAESETWRRLQVIWRHRPAFGRSRRSC